jgi:hypothetical protein
MGIIVCKQGAEKFATANVRFKDLRIQIWPKRARFWMTHLSKGAQKARCVRDDTASIE